MSALQNLSNALTESAAAVSPFVVAVSGGARFGASGVLWAPGAVITTRSTIRREGRLRVTLPGGETVPATLAGHDPGTDLALLRYEGGDAAASRPVLASSAKVGEVVIAVGRSENTGLNAAFGLISAVGKGWETWQGGKIDTYLRLDLTLYPGGSGAPVVNTNGELVGIVTGALSRIAPVAIPSVTIERAAAQLLAAGKVRKPWLGVAVQPVPSPAGLVVLGADAETPAAKAGVLVGDILVSLDGSDVRDPMDLKKLLSGHAPGDSVHVVLLRGGERRELDVVLGERAG